MADIYVFTEDDDSPVPCSLNSHRQTRKLDENLNSSQNDTTTETVSPQSSQDLGTTQSGTMSGDTGQYPQSISGDEALESPCLEDTEQTSLKKREIDDEDDDQSSSQESSQDTEEHTPVVFKTLPSISPVGDSETGDVQNLTPDQTGSSDSSGFVSTLWSKTGEDSLSQGAGSSESEEDGLGDMPKWGYEDPDVEEGIYEDLDKEQLDPLAKLLRLSKSNKFRDGQLIVRSLHETLQYVIDSPNDIASVLDVITTLSNNGPMLRTELMEQVPQIAFLCQDHPEELGGLVTANLIPIVVKFLTDSNDVVRKTSQAALLVLLEQKLVSHRDVQEQVCPVVLDLTDRNAVDYFKTEALALMSKMAPLVGKEMTEQLFLERFTTLCSDTMFQVRKVCAANFGEFCRVVGIEISESDLLPYFVHLCVDGVWGVRKACADVFTSVSFACSLGTRKTELSSLFVSLLMDESRWVRLAAFQRLGPFISTFADPNVTGLHYNDKGLLFIGDRPVYVAECPQLDADSVIAPNYYSRGINPSGFSKRWENSGDLTVGDSQNDMFLTNLFDDPQIKPLLSEDESSSETPQGEERSTEESKTEEVPVESEDGESSENKDAFGYIFASAFHTENEEEESSEVIQSEKEDSDSQNSDEKIEDETLTSFYGKTFTTEKEESLDSSFNVLQSEQEDSLDSQSEELKSERKEDSADRNDCTSPTESCESPIDSGIFSLSDSSSPKDLSSDFDVPSSSSPTSESDSVDDPAFNEINFWKVPLPDIFPALALRLAMKEQEKEVKLSSHCSRQSDELWAKAGQYRPSLLCMKGPPEYKMEPGKSLEFSTSSPNKACLQTKYNNILRNSLLDNQSIVPTSLLEHYISMTDPMKAETVDDEITRYCAYSLPAVALTLGPRHWCLIRATYKKLAADLHWKVRRTLAFSIHELAYILGGNLAQLDLMPVFEEFINDLDEVRIGVLKHLAQFLKMLPVPQRLLFLPNLHEFLNPENTNNWRFRLELALQLSPISALFSPRDCWRYIGPITLELMADKVVQIRQTCFGVVSEIASRMEYATVPDQSKEAPDTIGPVADVEESPNDDGAKESFVRPLCDALVQRFAQADTWTKRQSFAYVVGRIVSDRSMDLVIVGTMLMPAFIELAKDRVPNVRLVVAKVLRSSIYLNGYFESPSFVHCDLLKETMAQLMFDPDRDVQYFAWTLPDQGADSSFY